MYEGIGAWLSSQHVGASSSALAAAMLGHKYQNEPSYPHDVGDFGRCLRLCGMAGAGLAKEGLDALGAISGPWHRLGLQWSNLRNMYELNQTACNELVRQLVTNGDERSGTFYIRKGPDGRWDRFRTKE